MNIKVAAYSLIMQKVWDSPFYIGHISKFHTTQVQRKRTTFQMRIVVAQNCVIRDYYL